MEAYPLTIRVDAATGLEIDWSDGVVSRLPARALRAACPCATCRDEREKRSKNPLFVTAAADLASQIRLTEAKLAGRYALRLGWADGHDTGIYEFRRLRELANESEPGP